MAIWIAVTTSAWGCDETTKPEVEATKAPEDREANRPSSSGKIGTEGAPAAGHEATPNPADASVSEGTPCLQGKWHYDYGDHALESMIETLANAKLVKEEGSFVCTIEGGERGKMTCSTGGGTVINEVEANQMGMPMNIHIEMSGRSVTDYEVIAPGELRVQASDMSGLKMKGTLKIAGRETALDWEKFPATFGEVSSVTKFECEADALKLLFEHATEWQELTRVE